MRLGLRPELHLGGVQPFLGSLAEFGGPFRPGEGNAGEKERKGRKKREGGKEKRVTGRGDWPKILGGPQCRRVRPQWNVASHRHCWLVTCLPNAQYTLTSHSRIV